MSLCGAEEKENEEEVKRGNCLSAQMKKQNDTEVQGVRKVSLQRRRREKGKRGFQREQKRGAGVRK